MTELPVSSKTNTSIMSSIPGNRTSKKSDVNMKLDAVQQDSKGSFINEAAENMTNVARAKDNNLLDDQRYSRRES